MFDAEEELFEVAVDGETKDEKISNCPGDVAANVVVVVDLDGIGWIDCDSLADS